jgi:hypothetical protein
LNVVTGREGVDLRHCTFTSTSASAAMGWQATKMAQGVYPNRCIEAGPNTCEQETLSLQLEVPVADCGPQLALALQPFHRETGDHSGAQ